MNRLSLPLIILSVIALLNVETVERAAAAERDNDTIRVMRRSSGARLGGGRFRQRRLRRWETETADDVKSTTIHERDPKVYYVVVENVGVDERGIPFDIVMRRPVIGNVSVRDAIAELYVDSHALRYYGRLNPTLIKKVWISRQQAGNAAVTTTLTANWSEITQGRMATNHKVLPGDRVFVELPTITPRIIIVEEEEEPLGIDVP